MQDSVPAFKFKAHGTIQGYLESKSDDKEVGSSDPKEQSENGDSIKHYDTAKSSYSDNLGSDY